MPYPSFQIVSILLFFPGLGTVTCYFRKDEGVKASGDFWRLWDTLHRSNLDDKKEHSSLQIYTVFLFTGTSANIINALPE